MLCRQKTLTGDVEPIPTMTATQEAAVATDAADRYAKIEETTTNAYDYIVDGDDYDEGVSKTKELKCEGLRRENDFICEAIPDDQYTARLKIALIYK